MDNFYAVSNNMTRCYSPPRPNELLSGLRAACGQGWLSACCKSVLSIQLIYAHEVRNL